MNLLSEFHSFLGRSFKEITRRQSRTPTPTYPPPIAHPYSHLKTRTPCSPRIVRIVSAILGCALLQSGFSIEPAIMSNYPSAVFPYEDFPTAMQHNNGGMGYPMNSSLIDHNYQNQYSMNMNMPMSSHLQFGMPMQMPPQMSIPIQVGIPNQISMDNTPIESKPRMFGSPSSQEEFPLYSHSHSHSHSNSQAQLQLMSLSQSQSQVQIQTHQPQHRGSVAPPGVSPTDYARRQMAHSEFNLFLWLSMVVFVFYISSLDRARSQCGVGFISRSRVRVHKFVCIRQDEGLK